jgi:hypothetical protein
MYANKYKEVNCTEPSPSVRLPWSILLFNIFSVSHLCLVLVDLLQMGHICGQSYKTFSIRK